MSQKQMIIAVVVVVAAYFLFFYKKKDGTTIIPVPVVEPRIKPAGDILDSLLAPSIANDAKQSMQRFPVNVPVLAK